MHAAHLAATAFPRRPSGLLTTGITAVLALAAAAVLSACGSGQGAPAAPPARSTAVGVQVLKAEPVTLSTELPGRTTALLAAEVRPQVTGLIQARRFTEGGLVRAGQVLYQIDAASYQAAVASAQAAVAKAEATVQANRLTAQRQAELARVDAVSQQAVQDAQAALQTAQADLASAQAALATARINLQRTAITSPISGRVDVSTVTAGALVTADQASALTTVRQVDPIQVDITQSSAELLRLQRELASGQLQRLGRGEASVKLLLEDGSTYGHSGKLKVAGASVNTATGAVTLRAEFPNPEGLLLPGMYVRAQLPTAVAEQGLLVPQQAVSRNAAGQASVLVVGANNQVQKRDIATDRSVGSRWLVRQAAEGSAGGLRAGDRVIVEGSQKVKPGDTVQAQDLATTVAQR